MIGPTGANQSKAVAVATVRKFIYDSCPKTFSQHTHLMYLWFADFNMVVGDEPLSLPRTPLQTNSRGVRYETLPKV